MSSKFGTTFRTLRQGRHLSLSEACQGIMTKSALSKFENGHSTILFENLLPLLNRLYITFSEFLHAANDYAWNANGAFFRDLTNAYLNKNQVTVMRMIRQETAAAEGESDLRFHQINAITAKCVLALLKKTEVASTDIQFVIDYLFDQDNWMQYELSFLRYVIPFYPPARLLLLTKTMLRSGREFLSLGGNADFGAETYLSILATMLDNGCLADAKSALGMIEPNTALSLSLGSSLNLKELKAVLQYLSGEREKGLAECRRVVETASWLGIDWEIGQLNDQWEDLTGQALYDD